LPSILIERVPPGECITLDVGGHKNGEALLEL